MSRASEIVLLCEDEMHARLLRAYFRQCNIPTGIVRALVASKLTQGGNDVLVIRMFPDELQRCRLRAKKARSLLVVVLDADEAEVVDRRRQLAPSPPLTNDDPVVILIPKRNVETWIRAALHEPVNELSDYKNPVPAKDEVRVAAKTIHGWARNTPAPPSSLPPSLRDALPEWRRIG